MPTLAKPTLEYLQAHRAEMEAEYRLQDNQIREARRIREMERPALEGCENKYQLVEVDPRDPSVADEAFRVQASMSLNRPKLRLSHRESEAAESNATLREHWTEQTFWSIGTRNAGQDTMRDLADAAINDGGGWAKLIYSRDLWTGSGKPFSLKRPDKFNPNELSAYGQQFDIAARMAGAPFHWVNPDVLTLNPQWDGNGELCSMLEVTEHPLHTTLRQYRLKLDDGGNIIPDEVGMGTSVDAARYVPTNVTRLEFWDERYFTIAILGANLNGDPTGRIVKQGEHRYGFLPYDVAYGLWMSHWKNRKVGWSISMTKLWLVAYRAYLRAMHAQYVARDLLSPLHRQIPDTAAPILGEDGLPLKREEGPEPGWILNGVPGEVLNRIQYADAATLEKHIVLIDQAIEKLESPRVTSLEGLEGAGFAISQVLSFELVRFGPISNNLSELLRRQTIKLWSLVKDRVQQTVYVQADSQQAGYLGVGPDELSQPVGVQWLINPERATDYLIKERAAHERLSAGTLDKDSVIEYLAGNDAAWNRSPDEVRRGFARDEIRQSPAYKQWLQNAVAQAAGRGDIIATSVEALHAAQNGNLPGQNGVQPPPGMGNGVVPDMGNLAMAPNGRGAMPISPRNAAGLGTSPGVVVPGQGAAGGIQQIGG